jgi:chlorophyll synthase
LCYEGFAWVTGAVVMTGGNAPSGKTLGIAALYSLGAHGIMTLNDFKSIEGDRRLGVGSLPVRLGAEHAGEVACVAMALPQFIVVALLMLWGRGPQAIAVGMLLGIQLLLMRRLLTNPAKLAPWYNGTGVTLYVIGMLVTAFALKGIAQ